MADAMANREQQIGIFKFAHVDMTLARSSPDVVVFATLLLHSIRFFNLDAAIALISNLEAAPFSGPPSSRCQAVPNTKSEDNRNPAKVAEPSIA